MVRGLRAVFRKHTYFVLLSVFMLSACGERPNELRIGTAGQGGAFYPMGQSMSSLVTDHAADMRMVPIVTFGSVGNPRLVASREMDIAITSNNLIVLARAGKGPYEGQGELPLAAVGPLHFSVLHIMTLANTPIDSVADLRGKRIAVGPAGGGTIPFLEQILALEGMGLDDIVPSYVSYADGFSLMADGNVDAAFALTGYPAGAVMQARANKDLKFISLTPEQIKIMEAGSTRSNAVSIPKEIYGTPEDGRLLGVLNVLFTHNDQDAATIYEAAKAIYGNLDEFRQGNAIANQIELSNVAAINAPLHPGAAKFFAETGVINAAGE